MGQDRQDFQLNVVAGADLSTEDGRNEIPGRTTRKHRETQQKHGSDVLQDRARRVMSGDNLPKACGRLPLYPILSAFMGKEGKCGK